MACGFWLRVNGVWTPLEGVQKQVGREVERPSSSWTSVGGVRHIQYARRAARSWNLDLGHAGPEAVAALAMAAQGDAGDVWLWDESSARANMVDPVALAARPGYPVTDCGGMPVVSLTQGPSAPTTTVDVPLKANMAIQPSGASGPGLTVEAGAVESLVKVSVPDTPPSLTLASATLMLRETTGNGGTLAAYATTNAWVETEGATDYWTSVPAGASRGSAAITAATPVALSDVAAFAGTDMSLRLVKTSGPGSSMFWSRTRGSNPPVLRLTYTLLAAERSFTQLLRPGDYWISLWSDATAGTAFGNMRVDLGSGPIDAPLLATAGTGWRFMSAPFSLPNPVEVECTVYDSSAYLLAGLMLSNLDHPGVYLPPEKTPVRVRVDDPTLVLDWLYTSQQGQGPRTVTIREVGA